MNLLAAVLGVSKDSRKPCPRLRPGQARAEREAVERRVEILRKKRAHEDAGAARAEAEALEQESACQRANKQREQANRRSEILTEKLAEEEAEEAAKLQAAIDQARKTRDAAEAQVRALAPRRCIQVQSSHPQSILRVKHTTRLVVSGRAWLSRLFRSG